jgi:hypothetical protein
MSEEPSQSMMRRFTNLIYGAVPAEFESAFDLDESVQRLSSATGRSVFSAFTHQAAVGRVSKTRVSLQRVIPFVGNSFKPFFIGEFRRVNGRIVLSGRFTMLWWAKAFLTFWFGFCLLWTLLAILPLLARDPHTWWFPFAGIGMFGVGTALVRISKWFSRNDTLWLSRVIQGALSKEPPGDRLQGDPPPRWMPKRDWVERNWRWLIPLLCLVVAACFCGFFALVMSFMKSSDAYSVALERAKSAPAVIDALGTPIEDGFFVTGSVNIYGSSGKADLAIPISGPKGEATVYVAAKKSLGVWHFDGLVVDIIKTATRIDLSDGKREGPNQPSEPTREK